MSSPAAADGQERFEAEVGGFFSLISTPRPLHRLFPRHCLPSPNRQDRNRFQPGEFFHARPSLLVPGDGKELFDPHLDWDDLRGKCRYDGPQARSWLRQASRS
jgi:hypothetical protein